MLIKTLGINREDHNNEQKHDRYSRKIYTQDIKKEKDKHEIFSLNVWNAFKIQIDTE